MTVKKIWKCEDVKIVFRQVRRTLPGIKFLVLVEEEVAAGDILKLQFSYGRIVA